eukprot:CAMPEP_0178370446 /NCGR_PEP_ID=MMETSP0689_2-20121128/307_1 /TAXON_ID=160604 /ORGANISM="Amphidinium massartii, Strain CS-259" /LENGTH=404 /DNA_ID=CAMNT_0019990269 /DNA_START=84 /DNA_END=1294 /DNA_ORIENTATION=+
MSNARLSATGSIAASAVTSAGVTSLLFLRYLRQSQVPRLLSAPGNEAVLRELIANCPALQRPYCFQFHWLLSSMFAAVKAAPVLKLSNTVEEIMVLEDGGTVSLDWWQSASEAPPPPSSRPVVLVLPGLGNSSRSGYIREAMARLDAAGFQAVAFNYRCVEHLELTSPRFASADSRRDFPEVFEAIHKRHPDADLYALAYSMGGTMLMGHLGENPNNTPIKAAVAVSAPLAYEAHGRTLQHNPILSFLMTIPLKKWLLSKRQQVYALAGILARDIALATSLHRMLALIGKAQGFGTPDEYFRLNDPEPNLPKVQCPTLLICAADDPIIDPVPYGTIQRNPNLVIAETTGGSHLGWAGAARGWGPTLFAGSWADSLAVQFLQLHAGTGKQAQQASVHSNVKLAAS